jgi:hypothetical protein
MAGTVIYSTNDIILGNDIIQEHIWDWVADSSDGTVPDTASDDTVLGYVMLGETNPGAPAPTALYDVVLTNANDVDIFGGEHADRSASVSEEAMPKVGSAYGDRFINSVLTFALDNNSVNSAEGQFKVYVRIPHP